MLRLTAYPPPYLCTTDPGARDATRPIIDGGLVRRRSRPTPHRSRVEPVEAREASKAAIGGGRPAVGNAVINILGAGLALRSQCVAQIARHAGARGSGRVGHSAADRSLNRNAVR